jgi:Zn-dependent protease with chaperone function
VRAFSGRQEREADRKAVEILRAMGHAAPRRSLALALSSLAAASPRPKEDLGGLLASHPSLDERLAALEPLEAPLTPVASASPAK